MHALMSRLSSKYKPPEQKQSLKDELPNPIKESMRTGSNPFMLNISQKDSHLFFQFPMQEEGKLQKSDSFGKGSGTTSLKNLSRLESKTDFSPIEQSVKKYRQVINEVYNKQFRKRHSENKLSPQSSFPKTRFKAFRLFFTNKDKQPPRQFQKITQQNYLFHHHVDPTSRKIIIYELKPPRIKTHVLNVKESSIGMSIAYDPQNLRLFYFGNDKSELVIMSLKVRETICRVKVKYKRVNPILLLQKYKDKQFLLVIGGYEKNKKIAEGMKFIQIFLINKWQISLTQKIIKLNIGRIFPIIFESTINEETYIFIIGGNSVATVHEKSTFNNKFKYDTLSYEKNEDINFSTNLTGIKISSSFIYNCFYDEFENFFIVNNMHIRFENPLQLHSGCVLFRRQPGVKEKLQLFLPEHSVIFNLKIINNQISIIQSRLCMEDKFVQQNTLKFAYFRTEKHLPQLKYVDKQGKLRTVGIAMKGSRKEKQTCCSIM